MMMKTVGKIDWETGNLINNNGTVEVGGASKYAGYKGHSLCSELDHRSPRSDLEDIETGAHIQALDRMGQLTRMLMEANDWYVELDARYLPTKVVRQRNPELLQGSDPADAEGYDECDREDAMAPGRYDQLSAVGNESEDGEQRDFDPDNDLAELAESEPDDHTQTVEERWLPPRDKWDLLFVDDMNPDPEKRLQFSAPVFPWLRWKNSATGIATTQEAKGPFTRKTVEVGSRSILVDVLNSDGQVQRNSKGQVLRDWEEISITKVLTEQKTVSVPFLVYGKPVSRKELFFRLERLLLWGKALPSGKWLYDMCQGLTPLLRKRAWTLWWIEKARRQGKGAVKGKTVQKIALPRKTISLAERERLAEKRAAEIEQELITTGYLSRNNKQEEEQHQNIHLTVGEE